LDEGLLNRAKVEARKRGETLTSLIEQGLRLVLAVTNRRSVRRRVRLPVSRAGGGTRPGVDLDDTSAVLDRLDGLR
jgi:hypothetical protein